jgi:hypothetical protein
MRVLHWLSLRRPSRAEWSKGVILVPAERGDVGAAAAYQFWKNFQFLQHLKKTNQRAIAYLE